MKSKFFVLRKNKSFEEELEVYKSNSSMELKIPLFAWLLAKANSVELAEKLYAATPSGSEEEKKAGAHALSFW